jgi:hypothetical protein
MRKILFVMALCPLALACSGSSSTSDDAVEVGQASESEDALTASNDLSKAQSKLVLTLLDDACGDAWCEGDYDWRFARMQCHFAQKTCTLTTLTIDGSSSPNKTYWRSCKIPHLTKFEDLIETAPNGFQSLTDSMFDRATTCIEHIETHLPK